MKTLHLLFVLAVFVLLTGCADIIAHNSPSAYISKRNELVARYDARSEKYKTSQLNQQLVRQRAETRNEVQLAEIRNPTEAGASTQNGDIPGGFPVIFYNLSWENRTLIVKKLEGDMEGYEWEFYLPKRCGNVQPKLEVGSYSIYWINEYSNKRHYGGVAKVSSEPFYWDGRTKKWYHGGADLVNQ